MVTRMSNLFSFQLSCCGGLSRNVSVLGHSVTKCQKVLFSSPHNLHRGVDCWVIFELYLTQAVEFYYN